jgi:hypothetical protein
MINYDLKVTEQQNFIIQLRILRPELPLRTLEVLYYVWKYPDTYAKELIKAKMYKNLPVVNTTLSNLTDMELLIGERESQEGTHIKTMKRKLSPILESRIVKGSTEINIKLTQKEEL